MAAQKKWLQYKYLSSSDKVISESQKNLGLNLKVDSMARTLTLSNRLHLGMARY